MDSHGELKKAMITVLCGVLVCANLQGCSADVPHFWKKDPSRLGSSVVLPAKGNIVSLAGFSVSLNIGRPEKAFELEIDTGSQITWLECDLECSGCTQPRDRLYKPKDNFVRCDNPFCDALPTYAKRTCQRPEDPCPYVVTYADGSSSRGFLVNDYFSLKLRNGTLISELLVFGCGNEQADRTSSGVLGLGNVAVSILSQLSSLRVMRNVLGHCLSARGGGFLFLGDDLVPPSRITWVPLAPYSSDGHYAAGPAELLHNGKPTGEGGLTVVFDSGSTYTYFSSDAYGTALNKIKADVMGKPLEVASEDKFLPICWKGAKPFESVNEVKDYFNPLAFSFPTGNAQLQLLPQLFLIISPRQNVCLGILKGSEMGLGELIVIGDISMQDTIVTYDNEQKLIGWASMDCSKPPMARPVLSQLLVK